jgi:hypothetical protein
VLVLLLAAGYGIRALLRRKRTLRVQAAA